MPDARADPAAQPGPAVAATDFPSGSLTQTPFESPAVVVFQPDRHLLREQIRELGVHVDGIVLDVGAGLVTRYRDCFDCKGYVQLDLEASANIDVLGDAEALPFGSGRFDSVVCTQVLGDVRYPDRACAEFARVLRPGGVLLVTESLMNALHGEPRDYWRFTHHGLELLLASAGFELIEFRQRGGFFATLGQNATRYLIDRLRLYERRWTRVLRPLISAAGRTALLLDRLDRSPANRSHAMGWCGVARKRAEAELRPTGKRAPAAKAAPVRAQSRR